MSWNYSGDPASSDKDAVRFEVGDTDLTDQLLSDEEINFSIASEGNALSASARCCEALSRKFARKADFTLGPQSVRASQRSKAYADLGKELRKKAAIYSQGAGMYVGGVDPNDEKKDANLIPPFFKRRLMDNE